MLAPRSQSPFQNPYVFDAYPFQSHSYSCAHNVPPRRTIENDFHIVWHGDSWRLAKPRRIKSECSRNCFRLLIDSLFLEVRQVKYRNLAAGSQFPVEERRADTPHM